MAEAQQDVDTLKRRGRRRLVGAVALVLLAVVVLPMIFDPEPRGTPPVNVRIPGEDEGSFKPKPQVKPPASPPAPAPAVVEEKTAEEPKAAEKKSEQAKAATPKVQEPKAQKTEPAKPSATERARAEAALANAEFMVPVGAFANPDPVIAKLAAAKLRYYTEKVATSQGTVTRVRAGPFASKAEAEKAHDALKKLGFSPGGVSAKS